jgi:hypothetical protein
MFTSGKSILKNFYKLYLISGVSVYDILNYIEIKNYVLTKYCIKLIIIDNN